MFENKDNSNTDIENLGEFGLIDHLTKNFKIKQKFRCLCYECRTITNYC